MMRLISVAALGLTCAGLASPAFADKFSPPNSQISARGNLTVSTTAVSLSCQTVLTIQTQDSNNAEVTRAEFKGLGCLGVLQPSGLPWRLTARGTDNANFHGVTVSALGLLGICGPGKVAATIAPRTGFVTIAGASLPGSILPCSVSGTFRTQPHLSVVPSK